MDGSAPSSRPSRLRKHEHMFLFAAVIFALACLLITVSVAASDESDATVEFEIDGICYRATVQADVIGYEGAPVDVIIPSSVEYNNVIYPVKTINSFAFDDCTSLRSVVISDGMVTIGSYAFDDCISLSSITISDSVTFIGNRAFERCSSLTSVTIPDNVATIEYYAFSECRSLITVDISENVTELGDNVFYACSSLESINVSNDNPNYCSVDGVLFTKDMSILMQYPLNKADTVYEIPYGVTKILDYSFEEAANLVSVIISDEVQTIGEQAFYGSKSLTSVTIPNGVVTIGFGAFECCTSLTSAVIPSSVTNIGSYAFNGCKSLTRIDVSDDNPNYRSIDGVLFTKDMVTLMQYPLAKADPVYEVPSDVILMADCSFEYSSVTSVILGDNTVRIGGAAFRNCGSLTSVTIPKGLINIEAGAFVSCSSLIRIDVSDDNPNYRSIDGVLFNKSMTKLIKYPAGKIDSTYDIPSGVTAIDYAAFEGCASLMSVSIPESMTTIDGNAFMGCTSLTSVSIPAGVTSIELFAFDGCTSLSEISVSGSNTVYCSVDGVLFSKDMTALFRYPSGRTSATYTVPGSVTYIEEHAFMGCTNLTRIDVSGENADYRSVDGVLFTKNGYELIQYPAGRTDTEYAIPDGVEQICYGAFMGCRYLTSLIIPSTVLRIDEYAFSECTSLTSVIIGECVTGLGSYAFDGCTSLNIITIAGGPAFFGDDAFGECRFYDYDGETEITSCYKLRGYTYLGDDPSKLIRHDLSNVFFDGNGGSVRLMTLYVEDGQKFILPRYSGTMNGMSFSGWSYNGQNYEPGQEITKANGNMVFTAVWTEVSHEISIGLIIGMTVAAIADIAVLAFVIRMMKH